MTPFPPGSLAFTYYGRMSPVYDSPRCFFRCCTSFVDPGKLVLVLAVYVNDKGTDLRLILCDAQPVLIAPSNLILAHVRRR